MKWFNGLLLVASLVLWQVLSWAGIVPPHKIPSPLEVLSALGILVVDGLPPGYLLHRHMLESLMRVFCGFGIAAVLAIPLGILMGWSKTLRAVVTPYAEIVRPIPPLAWIPIAILWFGIGIKSAAFIIFLGAFFPILLNAVSGVIQVDPRLVEAIKVLGARERDILMKVLMPGALPSIWTGLRIGLGIGWMTLVAAEFTGVKSGYGLGYLIMIARDIQRPDEIVAGMAVIGLTGYLLDTILRRVESRLLEWM
jgi:NitT/TauT family transport system permease protein